VAEAHQKGPMDFFESLNAIKAIKGNYKKFKGKNKGNEGRWEDSGKK
jgi:hypothetical protein